MILWYILSLKVSKLIQWSHFLALKTKKNIIPVTEGSAVVHQFTWLHSQIDYLLEWGENSCISLQSIANCNGGDVPHIVNHCTAFNDSYYVFLVLNAEKWNYCIDFDIPLNLKCAVES